MRPGPRCPRRRPSSSSPRRQSSLVRLAAAWTRPAADRPPLPPPLCSFFASIFFNAFNLAPAVTNLVGFAIPAYLSVQALESTSTTDDKQWLTYWISFATLTVIESLALNWVLYWVPRWFVFKTVGLVYLQLPSTRGAAKLYEHVIRPVFVQKKLSQANVQSSFATATSSAPVDDHSELPPGRAWSARRRANR